MVTVFPRAKFAMVEWTVPMVRTRVVAAKDMVVSPTNSSVATTSVCSRPGDATVKTIVVTIRMKRAVAQHHLNQLAVTTNINVAMANAFPNHSNAIPMPIVWTSLMKLVVVSWQTRFSPIVTFSNRVIHC
jgi:hypothetical protein